MAASVTDILRRVGLGHSSMSDMLARARNLPRSSWGAALAHIGAGITVLGLCGMSGAQHAIVEIHVGETRSLAGDDWTLLNVHDYAGPNYRAMQADIAIRHNGKLIDPISSVSTDAGFSNLSNFNRAFLDEKGVTPRKYRLAAKNTNK